MLGNCVMLGGHVILGGSCVVLESCWGAGRLTVVLESYMMFGGCVHVDPLCMCVCSVGLCIVII